MKPYIVKSHDFYGGGFSIEFETKQEALKCIDDDLDTVQQNYKDEWREYRTIQNDCGAEVYVPDTDIFCEWKILEYGIASINDYIKYLDAEQLKVDQELFDVQSGKLNFEELSDDIRLEYEEWLKTDSWVY